MALQSAYDEEQVSKLAQDLSEQIVLVPGPLGRNLPEVDRAYIGMARKLYSQGWRKVQDDEEE